jgi:acetyl-CoA decarbonylase/synthase, CODH/ACS complex subunit gamma
MALTGLQIQKLLPKTNCKECGSNTCLAFAMKLAARKAEIAECPYASEEAIRVLGAAYEPPVKGIGLGPERTLRLGEETVLYRHEKTFVRQTALAVNVDDDAPRELIDRTLRSIKEYSLERVGEVLGVDLVAVTHTGGPVETFVALASRAWQETGKPLVLRSGSPEALGAAATAVAGSRSVLASATPETLEALLPVARQHGHALALCAANLDELVGLAGKVREAGFTDALLQLTTSSLAEQIQTNSIARRAAIKESFKPLGFAFLRFVSSSDLLAGSVEAVTEICKYGGICVLPAFDAAQLAALMTLRLNLYTDPQKPIQVEPNVYPIGEPNPDSPVFLTTNFSLTYFIVGGEIENAGLSAWLVVPECEGMSVLTAWAAGKFSGTSVAAFCKSVELDQKVRRREIVIPGYVSQISGELEENMPGWTVLVGPQEASDLESFIKARLA